MQAKNWAKVIVTISVLLIALTSTAEIVSEIPESCGSWLGASPKDRYQLCLKAAVATTAPNLVVVRALCREASGYTPGLSSAQNLYKGAQILPSYDADQNFEGLVASEIEHDSWLSKVGIHNGDVILQINGIPLSRPSLAAELIRQLPVIPSGAIKIRRSDTVQVIEYGMTN